MWDFFVCLGSQGEPLLKELGWFLRRFNQCKDLWKEEKEASPAGEKCERGNCKGNGGQNTSVS